MKKSARTLLILSLLFSGVTIILFIIYPGVFFAVLALFNMAISTVSVIVWHKAKALDREIAATREGHARDIFTRMQAQGIQVTDNSTVYGVRYGDVRQHEEAE